MKKFKRILSIVLAMTMVLAMGVTAFAADTTITVPATDDHEYEVYQIFTGDLADGVLSNVKWGKNGTGTEGDLVDQTTLDTIMGLKDLNESARAEALKGYVADGAAYKTVSKAAAITVPTGYYLLKDKNAPAENEEATLYIVQVVGPTTVTRKASSTDSDKKVDDVNDSDTSVAADNGKNQTSSDYDIGDDVPYHVSATASESVHRFHKYHITLEDILESGKFDAIGTLTIKVGSDTMTAGQTIDKGAYTITLKEDTAPTKDGFKYTVEWAAKETDASKDAYYLPDTLNKTEITIDFTAKLGQGAAIGAEGNKNTLKVKYSNNPNDKDGGEEGTTPDKVVITFTYKVVVDKITKENGVDKALEGAQFVLYKIPANTAEPTGDDAKDAAAKNAYYAGKAIQTWTTTAEDGKEAGKKNRFSFKGVDDGTYVLCETVTPAGYNSIDPQVFTVTATHDGVELTDLNGNKVTGDITFTPDVSAGSLSTDVLNNKGATLPSTGGMGTTIFYIVGAMLAVGAAVILVTKKRMNG